MKKYLVIYLIFGFYLSLSGTFGQTRHIVPRAAGEGGIGTSEKPWGPSFFSNSLTINGTMTLNGETITNWPTGGGGGGGGGLSGSSRVVTTNTAVEPTDYLIWLDTTPISSSDTIVLTLPDMTTESQTIVVRRLGNNGETSIVRGTNTFSLLYSGDGVSVDWLGVQTNWFWRTY